jgi:hypothetical protein
MREILSRYLAEPPDRLRSRGSGRRLDDVASRAAAAIAPQR